MNRRCKKKTAKNVIKELLKWIKSTQFAMIQGIHPRCNQMMACNSWPEQSIDTIKINEKLKLTQRQYSRISYFRESWNEWNVLY